MKVFFTSLFFLLTIILFGQQKPDIASYIKQYRDIAIGEMIRTKIPASITMAQGILESSYGKSPLAREANNHFGIKCKADWTGKKYFHDDDEAQECFRVYQHAEASYVDHSEFLLTRFRYAPLFDLSPTDYKAWAKGLKELGYATNPKYASILTTYIETYKLHELDQLALTRIEEQELLLIHSQSAQAKPAVVAEKAEVQEVPRANKELSEPITTKAEVLVINGIKAVKAINEEDPLQIAFDYGIDYSFVLAYNDLNNGERFKKGEYIFLQPKKNRAEVPTHTVKPGEAVRDVAQRFGIKLKDLYAKNLMNLNEQVYPGEVLYLQEKRTQPARTMSYYEYLRLQSRSEGTTQIKLDNTGSQYQVQHAIHFTLLPKSSIPRLTS
jgi:LysM repeat protein